MIKKKEGFQGQRAIVLPKKIVANTCEKNLLMNSMYVTDIGYYPKAKHHYRERLHGSDQNILIYCIEGKGNAEIGKKKYQINPGSFIIIPSKVAHRYAADEKDSWTIYWLHFKGDVAKKVIDTLILHNNGHHGIVNFRQKRIGLFEDIFYSLERGYGNDNLCYANMCLWHFLSSFLYNDKFYGTESKQSHLNDVIELSINYMQRNLSTMLLLGDIASHVNLSIPHFSSLFRKKTGFSPIEYFIHLKVQRACQYLLFTDLRIKEISEKLGVEDPYYFSRMFQKLMGISPHNYRKTRSS